MTAVSEQMRQVIAASIEARERLAGRALDLSERRRRMEQAAERLPTPAGVTGEAVDASGVSCEWIRPPAVTDGRVVLYLHGGGYAVGGLDTHRKMIGFLASAAGLTALSVDYRLAPEHPYPAALDDSLQALAWLISTGVPADEIVVAGDSAGGGLALATCLAARDRGGSMPGGLVMLSPWVDMAGAWSSPDLAVDDPIVSPANLEELRDWYVGDVDPTSPLVSPLRAGLAGLPPTLIHVGQREVLCADAVQLHQRLLDQGVDARCDVWDGMIHVWHFFAGYVPEADATLASVANWLLPR